MTQKPGKTCAESKKIISINIFLRYLIYRALKCVESIMQKIFPIKNY